MVKESKVENRFVPYVKKRTYFFLCFAIVFFFSCSLGFSSTLIDQILNDVTLPHEGRLSGVPLYYDWASEPRKGKKHDPEGFTAFTAWGQIYNEANTSIANNTLVEVKGLQAYIFSNSQKKYILVQNQSRYGWGAYVEDYALNAHTKADATQKNGVMTIRMTEGYTFHFWPADRYKCKPNDIGGILITAQARLILKDSKKFDDRSSAHIVMNVGADLWRNTHCEYAAEFKNNYDVGIGRFKYITNEWRSFYMTTMSRDQLENYPPFQ